VAHRQLHRPVAESPSSAARRHRTGPSLSPTSSPAARIVSVGSIGPARPTADKNPAIRSPANAPGSGQVGECSNELCEATGGLDLGEVARVSDDLETSPGNQLSVGLTDLGVSYAVGGSPHDEHGDLDARQSAREGWVGHIAAKHRESGPVTRPGRSFDGSTPKRSGSW